MDGGAWWATVHWVAKSQILPSNLTNLNPWVGPGKPNLPLGLRGRGFHTQLDEGPETP